MKINSNKAAAKITALALIIAGATVLTGSQSMAAWPSPPGGYHHGGYRPPHRPSSDARVPDQATVIRNLRAMYGLGPAVNYATPSIHTGRCHEVTRQSAYGLVRVCR